MLDLTDIPSDFPVRPLESSHGNRNAATCGTCGLSWDDSVATAYTPAPSARCPFEAFHTMAEKQFTFVVFDSDGTMAIMVNGVDVAHVSRCRPDGVNGKDSELTDSEYQDLLDRVAAALTK